MQVFRLVQPGIVDKVIAFEELPASLMRGIKKLPSTGLPRHWREFAPEFYVLDYISTNNDKERWEQISNHVRRVVEPSVRLMDKLEDMARPMAPNSKDAVDLEPEDVPVIPLPSKEVASTDEEQPKRGPKSKKTAGE